MSSFFPIKLAISKLSPVQLTHEETVMKALFKWTDIEIKDEDELKEYMTTYPYGVFSYVDESTLPTKPNKEGREVKVSQRRGENVTYINTQYLIFDIDDNYSLERTHMKLDDMGVKYATITTKSHGIKGDGDRYRVFLPINWELDSMLAVHPTLMDGTKKQAKQISDMRKQAYTIGAKTVGAYLFPYKKEEEIEVVDEITGEITKQKVMVDASAVDEGPLAPQGKYYPSPKHSLWHSHLGNPVRNIFTVSDELRSKIVSEIKKERENVTRKKVILSMATLKNQDIGTYEWFVEHKDYPVIVNEGLMKSLDLSSIILHYEQEDEENAGIEIKTTISAGKDIIHVPGSDGACYHINIDDNGSQTYHDYNTHDSGSIVGYMFRKFPDEFSQSAKTNTLINVARKLIIDFKDKFAENDIDISKKLILNNPAFYLEDYILALENKKEPAAVILTKHLKDKKLIEFDFVKENTMLRVVKENGWKLFFPLEEKTVNRIAEAKKNLFVTTALSKPLKKA